MINMFVSIDWLISYYIDTTQRDGFYKKKTSIYQSSVSAMRKNQHWKRQKDMNINGIRWTRRLVLWTNGKQEKIPTCYEEQGSTYTGETSWFNAEVICQGFSWPMCQNSLLKIWSMSSHGDNIYRGGDKSLARPTSRCIFFDGENISFDASLVIYINSTNIPPIMIINRIYEYQNLLSL